MSDNTVEITPANLKLARERMTDESKIGSQYASYAYESYVNKLVELGLDARKNSIKWTLKRREEEAQAKAIAQGIDVFIATVNSTPELLSDLGKLLELAAKLKVPSDKVLEYHNRRPKTA